MSRVFGLVLMAAAMIMNSGCASIVSKSQWPVVVNSTPSGATVTVRNRSGMPIMTTTTPTTITLDSGYGFFKGANYTFQFEKEGYSSSAVTLSSKLNTWYVCGNFFIGGLLGWCIVDPLTGAMYKLDESVYGNLAPSSTAVKPSQQAPAQMIYTVQTPPVSSSSAEDTTTQLKRLRELKENGLITEDEFNIRWKVLADRL